MCVCVGEGGGMRETDGQTDESNKLQKADITTGRIHGSRRSAQGYILEIPRP